MVTVQYKFPGESSRRVVDHSQLDQNALYRLGHPNFEVADPSEFRYTFPVVRGSDIAKRVEELTSDRDGLWASRDFVPIVYPFGENSNSAPNEIVEKTERVLEEAV